jgi:hypothetical protein
MKSIKSILLLVVSISFSFSFLALEIHTNSQVLAFEVTKSQGAILVSEKVIHSLSTVYPQAPKQKTIQQEPKLNVVTNTTKAKTIGKNVKKNLKKTTPLPSALPPKINTSSNINLEEAIHSSCHQNGCIGEQLIKVMYCESGGRSNAINGVHKGIFQFNPRTFNANSKRAGLENPDIWNPEHQIKVASWMFGNGQSWQWSCK